MIEKSAQQNGTGLELSVVEAEVEIQMLLELNLLEKLQSFGLEQIISVKAFNI